MTTRLSSLTAALFLTGMLAGGGASAARDGEPVKRFKASAGEVSVEVTLRPREGGCPEVRATITRAGRELARTSLVAKPNCDVTSPGLRVRDLDGDGEPEILIDLTRERRLLHLQLGIELVASDPAFAVLPVYGGPDAQAPIQIWRWERQKLVDATRDFPALIEQDAKRLLRLYERARKDVGGDFPDVRAILPAYLADQYLLGREQDGWQLLERAFKRGELGRGAVKDGWPAGRSYLRKLRAYLESSEYAR